ncbi:hypothetical protein GCM10010275_49990 [Streptomyces litmocidini]|nr:hypothetical protein GCM10010275_49990 [Streptomyces litmocidini]
MPKASGTQEGHHDPVDHIGDLAFRPFASVHLGAVHRHGGDHIEDEVVDRVVPHLSTGDSTPQYVPEEMFPGLDHACLDQPVEAFGGLGIAFVNHCSQDQARFGVHHVPGPEARSMVVLDTASAC